jgi:predicted amidohydrolase YtcJ
MTVVEIFDAAVDLPEAEQEVFLQRACAGDEALLRKVHALLKAHMAVKDGRIVGVDEPDKFQAGPNTQVIDLNDRGVIPGLNDSHLHVIRGGLNYNMELRWDGVPSLADALRMLKEQAQRTPLGQWVRVVGG